ncbi:MAG TPA: hypothetical protein EYO62_05485 [Aquificales bacterium]|nr:hypothetical protein [Aquificales bacterium]
MQRGLTLIVFSLFLISCGKKSAPIPPPSDKVVKVKSLSSAENKALSKGKGGFLIGDSGVVVLYWSFPIKVDYSVIFLNGREIATTPEWNYLYPKPLERGKTYTFKVVGIKKDKPVAETIIKVSY